MVGGGEEMGEQKWVVGKWRQEKMEWKEEEEDKDQIRRRRRKSEGQGNTSSEMTYYPLVRSVSTVVIIMMCKFFKIHHFRKHPHCLNY